MINEKPKRFVHFLQHSLIWYLCQSIHSLFTNTKQRDNWHNYANVLPENNKRSPTVHFYNALSLAYAVVQFGTNVVAKVNCTLMFKYLLKSRMRQVFSRAVPPHADILLTSIYSACADKTFPYTEDNIRLINPMNLFGFLQLCSTLQTIEMLQIHFVCIREQPNECVRLSWFTWKSFTSLIDAVLSVVLAVLAFLWASLKPFPRLCWSLLLLFLLWRWWLLLHTHCTNDHYKIRKQMTLRVFFFASTQQQLNEDWMATRQHSNSPFFCCLNAEWFHQSERHAIL